MGRFICFTLFFTLLVGHYDDVMTAMASQITSLTFVYSTVYSGAYQRKHQSSASLAFVREIHRRTVNSLHKWPVTRKMFPFDDVIMETLYMMDPTQMTSWPRWRLKSPASRLFTQLFIRVHIKENIKAPRHWPLCGEFTVERWIPCTNGQ